jgi:hypothetical protein
MRIIFSLMEVIWCNMGVIWGSYMAVIYGGHILG